jgi:hypothetical protein
MDKDEDDARWTMKRNNDGDLTSCRRRRRQVRDEASSGAGRGAAVPFRAARDEA